MCKKSICFIIITFVLQTSQVFAQFSLERFDTNYFDVTSRFYSDPQNLVDSGSEGGIYQKFKRWQHFWKDRSGPTGDLLRGNLAYQQYANNFYQSSSNIINSNIVDNWKPLGPFGRPSGSLQYSGNSIGNGQMNRIAFDDDDLNVVYATSGQMGGLWIGNETSNQSNQFYWTPLSDNVVPNIGCGDVAIVNNGSDKYIFISLGDPNNFYEMMGLGIYRSKNGSSFIPCNNGLISNDVPFMSIPRIIQNPFDPDELFIATTDGIYKTNNATTSCDWEKVVIASLPNESFRGLAFKPNSGNELYASGQDIYQSNDNGNSWNSILLNSSLFQTTFPNRTPAVVNIAITEQPGFEDELTVNILVPLLNSTTLQQYVWRYDGSNWVDLGEISSTFGIYKDRAAIAVSNIDHEIIYSGSDGIYKRWKPNPSNPYSWFNIGSYNGTIHADIHDLKIDAYNRLLVACDGGIYISNDPTVASYPGVFFDISDGLQVGTIVGMGTSPSDPDVIIVGEQDCGSNFTKSANQTTIEWQRTLNTTSGNGWWDGDALHCLVDNTNSNIMYATSLYRNSFLRTTDSWTSDFIPVTFPGYFHDNYFHHKIGPHDNMFYYAILDLYSLNGSTWERRSDFVNDFSNIFGTSCVAWLNGVAFATSDRDVLYVPVTKQWCQSLTPHVFKTTTGGGKNSVSPCYNLTTGPCWVELSLPGISEIIRDMAVSSTNPEHVYFVCSGFTPNEKVYESTDGGSTWTNISYNLPNMPVNCIAYENGSNDQIYIGTDVGVYYTNKYLLGNGTGWVKYFDNVFPSCVVTNLEINYKINKIRAGTWGRGVWESPLSCPVDLNLTLNSPSTIDEFIEAQNGIYSTSAVLNGNLVYRAGSEIFLNPGFECDANSTTKFLGFIHGCNSEWNSFRRKGIVETKDEFTNLPKSNGFILIPNPTASTFRVQTEDESDLIKHLIVYNSQGTVIFDKSDINTSFTEINISEQKSGIYFVKVFHGDEFHVKKIVRI
jgi:hypothetical protein